MTPRLVSLKNPLHARNALLWYTLRHAENRHLRRELQSRPFGPPGHRPAGRGGAVPRPAAVRAREGFEAWDFEIRQTSGPTYAIDTVRAAEARFPGAAFYYIIGEDNVADLPKWKDVELLRQKCTFVPYPRTRESSTEIRRRLLAGEPVDDLVPPCVAAALGGA